MRHLFFYLLTCMAFVTACQPVTQTSMKDVSPNPELTIKDDALLSSTKPESSAPPIKSVPSGILSSNNVDQKNSQTEIDLTVSTFTTDIDAQTSTPRVSPVITPEKGINSKTFDPTKTIGLVATMLIRDLGKANIIRKEGPIEVWQYHFTSCVVDFFFYPVEEGQSQLVARSWDMRNPVIGDGLDRGKCRAEMDLYHQKIISNS